jgi:hypothetical protein
VLQGNGDPDRAKSTCDGKIPDEEGIAYAFLGYSWAADPEMMATVAPGESGCATGIGE